MPDHCLFAYGEKIQTAQKQGAQKDKPLRPFPLPGVPTRRKGPLGWKLGDPLRPPEGPPAQRVKEVG